MLVSYDDLEAALERLTTHLASPPRPGTEADEEFQRLLAEIDAFNPSFSAPGEETRWDRLADRAADLKGEAERLKSRREDEQRRGGFAGLPKDGRGAGPTTGI